MVNRNDLRIEFLQSSAISPFPFGNILASPRLSRNLCIFRPKNPIDCRLLSRNLCILGQKARSILGHYVTHHFVFIHIPGGSFIFNIFMDQRPVSDLEKHIRAPPQLAQAGIFHPLHEHRAFVVRVNAVPVRSAAHHVRSCERIKNLTQRRQGAKTREEQLLCFHLLFTTLRLCVKCFCSSRDYFTPSSASGRWPQELVYTRLLPLSTTNAPSPSFSPRGDGFGGLPEGRGSSHARVTYDAGRWARGQPAAEPAHLSC